MISCILAARTSSYAYYVLYALRNDLGCYAYVVDLVKILVLLYVKVCCIYSTTEIRSRRHFYYCCFVLHGLGRRYEYIAPFGGQAGWDACMPIVGVRSSLCFFYLVVRC